MSSTNRWNWLVLPLIVVAMLTMGAAWTGCSSDSGDPAATGDDGQDDADDGSDDADDGPDDGSDGGTGTDDADPDDGDTTTDTTAAGGLLQAAQSLTAATDYAAATKALAAIKKAVADATGTTTDAPGTVAAVAVDPSKVSTFAPAGDLVGQVDALIEGLEETLAAEEDFADSSEDIAKNGNTLVVVALALALHDQDNKYKAASTEAAPGELKWEKVAALAGLMVKVPGLNTPLKSSLRTASRFKGKAADLAGKSAALAVIAQASIGSVDETEKPDEVQQWEIMCGQLRDAAAAYNAACHAEDFAAAKEANTVLQATCQACHDIFHTEEEH